jgi:hypothetical protein
MPAITRKRRWKITALLAARRYIRRLGPYQSLALMLLPILLVEPLKIVALFVVGHGHWLTGTGMLVAAYGVSLVVVERLFKVVKFKLMTMNWFADLWRWFTAVRDRMLRRQPGQAVGQRVDGTDVSFSEEGSAHAEARLIGLRRGSTSADLSYRPHRSPWRSG